MYISSLQDAGTRIEVSKITTNHRDGWDYMIAIGMNSIYLSRAEMLDLEQRIVKHLADAWADEADDVSR